MKGGGAQGEKKRPVPLFYLPSSDSCIVVPKDLPGIAKGLDSVKDRIKGCIFGHAIGDAIGLATEFMNTTEVEKHYGPDSSNRKTMNYEERITDFHRSRWEKGDWTDDTDQLLSIMQSITFLGGKVDPVDIARRIKFWCIHGFPELGDTCGNGIGRTVHSTVMHPRFEMNPESSSREVWERSGRYLAANGAVMRTAVLGVVSFHDLEAVRRNASSVCRTTHYDPRCSASCVVMCALLAMMLQGELDPSDSAQLEEMIQISVKLAVCDAMCGSADNEGGEQMPFDADELVDYCDAEKYPDFESLKLDDQESIGYTYKCLASGLVGVRSNASFEETITRLAMQGGDADTNGAVCGALLGCRVGYAALPPAWIDGLKHKVWLEKNVDILLNLMFPSVDDDTGLDSDEDRG